jgi:hypothetical protein
MKYVFLFCGTREQQTAWEGMSAEERERGYARVGQWFEEHRAKITGGNQLASPSTATTVRPSHNGSEPLVTDGPFMEGNEVIGGYVEVEVPDLDEALRMARGWPAGPVEIRPVLAMT